MTASKDPILECLRTLESLVQNREKLEELTEENRKALLKAAGMLSRPDKKVIREYYKSINHTPKKKQSQLDRALRAQVGIRKSREASIFTTPKQIPSPITEPVKILKYPRNCYVCTTEFVHLHHFYDSMCPPCAEFNYQKRFQTADLTNQVALITGSRLKIGYQSTLMMLRAGAHVVATTRFPIDSAFRFSKEEDYIEWKDRLHIFGLDLRHTPSVELFTQFFKKNFKRLDILINNAAQTVRRAPGFYGHLIENENTNFHELPKPVQGPLELYTNCILQLNQYTNRSGANETQLAVGNWHKLGAGIGLKSPAQLSQIPYSCDSGIPAEEIFPTGLLDADLQQIDLSATNSWRLKLGEINTPEMLEVQLVNAIAPFVLCNRLIPLMKKDLTGQKHIVNVSAMEGKFYRFRKADRHPHTNMAKAALNMMTHTAASSLAREGIFINAVDTGWVTDEDPIWLAQHKQAVHDFQPPLDIVDGAARVCDPFFHGITTGQHWSGKFLKDYQPIDW